MFQPFGKELHAILGDDRLKMLSDPAACAQLLQDKSSLTTKENELLVSVLRNSIANKLRETTWRKSIEISTADINTFIAETQEQGYTEDHFRWAIEAWAEALEVTCKYKTKKKATVQKKETKPPATSLLTSKRGFFGKIFKKKTDPSKEKTFPAEEEKGAYSSQQETDMIFTQAESTGQTDSAAGSSDTPQAAAGDGGSEGTGPEEWWENIQEAETSINKEDSGERYGAGGHHRLPGKRRESYPKGTTAQQGELPKDHKSAFSGLFQQLKSKRILLAAGVLLIAAISLYGVITVINQPAKVAASGPQTEPSRTAPVQTDEKQEPVKGSAEGEKEQPASDNNSGGSVEAADVSTPSEPQPAPQDPDLHESGSATPAGGDLQPEPESGSSDPDRQLTGGNASNPTIPEPDVNRPPVPDQLGKELPKVEDILKELQQTKQTAVLFRKLAEYKSMQLLGYGEKRNFSPIEGCFIFICDRQQVKEIYHVRNNMYHSLSTGQQYADITTGLAKGEKDLWVQFAK